MSDFVLVDTNAISQNGAGLQKLTSKKSPLIPLTITIAVIVVLALVIVGVVVLVSKKKNGGGKSNM